MKKAKKILALLLCAVLLIGASVAGTMAYLTFQTNEVTNTFTIGKVEIKLDEAVVDKETGAATSGRTETGNTAVRLIPGRSITKDPTVTVLKDSEDCYVRVKVTVDLSANLTPDAAKAAGWITDEQDFADAFKYWAGNFAGNYLITGSEKGFNRTNWKVSDPKVDSTAMTVTYILYYENVPNNNIVRKSASDTKLPAVFDKVVAPRTLTKDQLALLEGMEIKVEAHAIQAEGFTATGTEGEPVTAEQNAWMAFDG